MNNFIKTLLRNRLYKFYHQKVTFKEINYHTFKIKNINSHNNIYHSNSLNINNIPNHSNLFYKHLISIISILLLCHHYKIFIINFIYRIIYNNISKYFLMIKTHIIHRPLWCINNI